MRIGRTLPPTAAPVAPSSLIGGLGALLGRPGGDAEGGLAAALGARRAFLAASGKAALVVALRALHRLSGRREVVIPAYTCFSVPAAVFAAGLEVRPCDVDPATLDLDPAALDRAVGPRTLAVVATDLFGLPADVGLVRRLCAPHGTFVLEDAAQALGVSQRGQTLGLRGDLGIVSFGRGKHLNIGGGGAVLAPSAPMAQAVADVWAEVPPAGWARGAARVAAAALEAILIRPSLYWLPAGIPALGLGETHYPERFAITRLASVQAGLLGEALRRLRRTNARRAASARALLRALGVPDAGNVPAYLRLPVLADSEATRDAILARARAEGLGIARMYPTPITAIPAVRRRIGECRVPGAEVVAARLLTLPTHPLVTPPDLLRIGKAVAGRARPVLPGDAVPAEAAVA